MQCKVVIKSARTGRILRETRRPAKSGRQAKNWVRRRLFGKRSFAKLEQAGYLFETEEDLSSRPLPPPPPQQPMVEQQLSFSFCNQSGSLAAFTR